MPSLSDFTHFSLTSEIATSNTPNVTYDVPTTTAPAAEPVVIPHRAPTPPDQDQTGEAALNAAAAREVSRELDQPMFTSQTSPQPANDAQASIPSSPSHPSPQPSYQPSYQMHRAQSPPTSPTGSGREALYLREKDRSSSGLPSRQPTPGSPTDPHGSSTQNPLAAPLSIRTPIGASPSAFHAADPAPTTPSSFYGLGPSATGSSTSFIPGANPRTISAAAFKRQVRNASQPISPASTSPPDGGFSDTTSPLHVKKKGLPGSPYGAQDMERTSSAPEPGNLQEPMSDAQFKRASAGYAVPPAHQQQYQNQPYQQRYSGYYHQDQHGQQQGKQDEEDSYDYLSAYMTNDAHDDGALR